MLTIVGRTRQVVSTSVAPGIEVDAGAGNLTPLTKRGWYRVGHG
jgi:hypothetical protein